MRNVPLTPLAKVPTPEPPRVRAGGRSRFTEERIREIRRLQGQKSARDLAERLGVSTSAVFQIWRREIMGHVHD